MMVGAPNLYGCRTNDCGSPSSPEGIIDQGVEYLKHEPGRECKPAKGSLGWSKVLLVSHWWRDRMRNGDLYNARRMVRNSAGLRAFWGEHHDIVLARTTSRISLTRGEHDTQNFALFSAILSHQPGGPQPRQRNRFQARNIAVRCKLNQNPLMDCA